jgi:hypothetical protein
VREHLAIALAIALVIGSQRMLIITCATRCETSHHATTDASPHDAHGAAQHVNVTPDNVPAPEECRHVFARYRPGPTQIAAQPAVATTASGMVGPTSIAIPLCHVARIAGNHGPPVIVLRI